MISIHFNRLRAIVNRCQVGLYLLLALFGGTLLPIQVSLNAQLARSLNSVVLAADISYLVGLLTLLVLLSTGSLGHPDWWVLPKAPRWTFLGGVLGAWYVASSAYFTSVLGATVTLAFVVCGQAIAGIIIDHFGWLGVPQRRLTPNRRLAIGLLITALFLLAQS